MTPLAQAVKFAVEHCLARDSEIPLEIEDPETLLKIAGIGPCPRCHRPLDLSGGTKQLREEPLEKLLQRVCQETVPPRWHLIFRAMMVHMDQECIP